MLIAAEFRCEECPESVSLAGVLTTTFCEKELARRGWKTTRDLNEYARHYCPEHAGGKHSGEMVDEPELWGQVWD